MITLCSLFSLDNTAFTIFVWFSLRDTLNRFSPYDHISPHPLNLTLLLDHENYNLVKGLIGNYNPYENIILTCLTYVVRPRGLVVVRPYISQLRFLL